MCSYANWSLSAQETLQISNDFLLFILANVMGCDRGDDRGWVHNGTTRILVHRCTGTHRVYTYSAHTGCLRVNWS